MFALCVTIAWLHSDMCFNRYSVSLQALSRHGQRWARPILSPNPHFCLLKPFAKHKQNKEVWGGGSLRTVRPRPCFLIAKSARHKPQHGPAMIQSWRLVVMLVYSFFLCLSVCLFVSFHFSCVLPFPPSLPPFLPPFLPSSLPSSLPSFLPSFLPSCTLLYFTLLYFTFFLSLRFSFFLSFLLQDGIRQLVRRKRAL